MLPCMLLPDKSLLLADVALFFSALRYGFLPRAILLIAFAAADR